MFTLLGKILVLVNLTLSLLLAGVALGIKTNAIDWPGTAAGGGKGQAVQGVFPQRKAEFQALQPLVAQAARDWRRADADLATRQQERAKDLKWFNDQLLVLDQGPGPIQQVAPNQPGQAAIGPPAMQPASGKLMPRGDFLRILARLSTNISRELTRILDLENQESQLTAEMEGTRAQPGLRALIGVEQQAAANSEAEAKTVEPLRINYQVDAQVLRHRQQVLKARVAELEQKGSQPASSRP
jgi:hypothetical protein